MDALIVIVVIDVIRFSVVVAVGDVIVVRWLVLFVVCLWS